MTLLPTTYGKSLTEVDLPRRSQQPGRAAEDNSGDKKRVRQAWLQEMERANLSDWFQPFAAGRSSVMPSPGKTPAKPEPQYSELRSTGSSGFSVSRALGALPAKAASASAVSDRFSTAGHSISNTGSPAAATLPTEKANAASTQRPSFAEPGHAESDSSSRSSMEAFSAASTPGFSDLSDRGNRAIAQGAGSPEVTAMRAVGSGPAPNLQTTVPLESDTGTIVRQVAAGIPWNASFIDAAVPEAVLPNASAYFIKEFSSEVPVAQRAASEGEAVMSRVSTHVDPSLRRLETTAALSARVSGGAASQNVATRLHANWTSEGLNLWVGMNGTAQQVTAQAAVIVNTLQRTLRNQGERLCRVVCNGAVVYDAATSSNAPRFDDFSSVLDRYNAGHPAVGLFSFPSPKEAP